MKTKFRLCASEFEMKKNGVMSEKTDIKNPCFFDKKRGEKEKSRAEFQKMGMRCSYSIDEEKGGEELSVVEFGLDYAYSDKHKVAICELVCSAIKKVGNLMIQSHQNILFIGVGNPAFTADCFGVCVSKRIYSKLFLSNQTASTRFRFHYFNPDIRAKTGLDTIALTNLVIEQTRPDIIFLFDCYATKRTSRVGKIIEVKNKALRPASAVEGYDDQIKADGAKIISIGAVLLKVSKNDQMLSMRTNADLLTTRLSEIVADAVVEVLEEL